MVRPTNGKQARKHYSTLTWLMSSLLVLKNSKKDLINLAVLSN